METKQYEALALNEATKSPCHKRKVGAVIVDTKGYIVSSGHNYNLVEGPCEDSEGKTLDSVIHAEVDAITNMSRTFTKPLTIYVTHNPCVNCLAEIKRIGIENIVVVEQFMKFDTSKLRYDLIPTSTTKALAQVLTYGAKKYKPNNWQTVDDTDRYVAALFRHIEAWRDGEKLDKESGLHHLAHALTNVAFLLHLDKPTKRKR
jgi:deoxycytidylate deaminase